MSDSCSGLFIPGELILRTHLIGSYEGYRACLDAVEMTTCACRSNTIRLLSSPWPSHCTDSAKVAHLEEKETTKTPHYLRLTGWWLFNWWSCG